MARRKFQVVPKQPLAPVPDSLPERVLEGILTTRTKWTQDIPLDRIRPNPYQARKEFDPVKLAELAEGMRVHGFITRLLVRPHPTEEDAYELVYGERRLRAAHLAELAFIPCDIAVFTDDDMSEMSLLENVQREDLTNAEQADIYAQLLAKRDGAGRPKYSIRSLAARLGKDKSYIESLLPFVRAPKDVRSLIAAQPDVPPRIVRELEKLLTPEERAPLIEEIEAGNLNVEDVRAIVKEHTQTPVAPPPSVTPERQQAPVRSTAAAGTARRVFERVLKRNHEIIMPILEQYQRSTGALGEEEKALLLHHVTQWSELMSQIIEQLH